MKQEEENNKNSFFDKLTVLMETELEEMAATSEVGDKIINYYEQKCATLSNEERRKLFKHIIHEGLLNEQFDNNAFFEILSTEEQQKAQKIEFIELVKQLKDTFDYSKFGDFAKLYMKILTIAVINSNQKAFNNEFANEIKLYKNILATYKGIAEELKLSTALELSYFYTYLLWNGYFSITQKHNYDLKDRKANLSFLAADVLNGKGVCLEYSALLNDFLKACNKESLLMFCYVSEQKGEIKFDYIPNIKTNISKESSKQLRLMAPIRKNFPLIKKLGNHAVTVINEDGEQFVFDATNLSVLNIEDNLIASMINGSGYFYLKPYSVFFGNQLHSPTELFKMIENATAHSNLKRKDIIFGYENTLELVEQNKPLLDDGYRSIKPSIEQISARTLAMKKFNHR